MKRSLFLMVSLVVIRFASGQLIEGVQTDENGKIYFQKNIVSHPLLNQNLFGPNELMLDWSLPDFNLSDNPGEDSWDVRLATEGNDVYVVYNDNHTNGLQKIMYRKKINDDEWSEAIFVDAGGEIGARNNHFPAIDAAPNGDLHVAYNVWAFENTRNYIGYSHYDAGTDTWVDGVKISDLNGTVDHFNSYKDVYVTDDNLPVVVWGYDFRENQTNEEIYMTYFDGSNWSADIAVSDVTDGQNAGVPYMRGIGNGKAMILYSEYNSGGTMDFKYRIYDEATHVLSDPEIIVNEAVMNSNYAITSKNGQTKVMHYFKMTSPDRDAINLYDYDAENDVFTISPNTFEVAANAGGLLKRMDMDCTVDGDCGVVFTDFLAQTISFLEYDASVGFGTPHVICEEDPQLDFPSVKFDDSGNFHAAWSDMRNDPGTGWSTRETIYKMGRNEDMGTAEILQEEVTIYPNPSNGRFTIHTKDSYKVEIFNVAGKLVNTSMISGVTLFQKSFPAGVYFVKFSNEKGTIIKKLIIR